MFRVMLLEDNKKNRKVKLIINLSYMFANDLNFNYFYLLILYVAALSFHARSEKNIFKKLIYTK